MLKATFCASFFFHPMKAIFVTLINHLQDCWPNFIELSRSVMLINYLVGKYILFSCLFNVDPWICLYKLKILHNFTVQISEAFAHRCSAKKGFCKKGILKNFIKFTEKHSWWSFSFINSLKICNFIKRRPQHMFFCELCGIFRNT